MRTWNSDMTDQGYRAAFNAFSRTLAQRPGVYGISPADVAEAVRLAGVVDEATILASAAATRTPLTTAAKRQALEDARKFFTRLAAFIRINPNVSDEDRALIGVPAKTEPRRIPAPTTSAMLAIRQIIPGGHVIEFVDSTAPDRRGKPQGTIGLELFVAYSPNNGGGDAGLSIDTIIKTGKPHSVLTRCPAKVIHPNERVGSIANYIGRWMNGRKEAGPWSQPVRMVLAMPGEGGLKEAA